MNKYILQTGELKFEADVVRIRQKARSFARVLGFEQQDQVRIATAVSEIARNAFEYAGGGRVEFAVVGKYPQRFQIIVKDSGPGIRNLPYVLSGEYVSHTGMGVGMAGAKKLMGSMVVESHSDALTGKTGTTVTLEKARPENLIDITPAEIGRVHDMLSALPDAFPLTELQVQNKELFLALDELKKKQDELAKANDELAKANEELADTNKGVLALYTELDEQALALKRANNTKSAFLANMTHEFRSPLNTILNISSLLLDKEQGLQNSEHLTQVRFIQKSASSLSTLVNDLLDIAKVEAGKISVRTSEFSAGDVFGSLRGLMKPLLVPHQKVELMFESCPSDLMLNTDEGKLSQILKNLISNALKYTTEGEVRVSCHTNDTDEVVFQIQDTGIGISEEDQKKIFEEFFQVDSPLQKSFKGTGLGLPLSERLARLLGGRILVQSEVGKGSCFSVILPRTYQGEREADYLNPVPQKKSVPVKTVQGDVFIIDDNQGDRYFLKNLLFQFGVQSTDFENAKEALQLVAQSLPRLIFLDMDMPGMSGYDVLKELMMNPKTKSIPVVIHSSQVMDKEDIEYFSEIGVQMLPKGPMEAGDLKLRRILEQHDLLRKEAPL